MPHVDSKRRNLNVKQKISHTLSSLTVLWYFQTEMPERSESDGRIRRRVLEIQNIQSSSESKTGIYWNGILPDAINNQSRLNFLIIGRCYDRVSLGQPIMKWLKLNIHSLLTRNAIVARS